MISKNSIPSTQEKNMARKTSHIKLISAMTTFGLLASQSVYAADEASSGGIPGWVWGILVLAILAGVMLLPKKWTEPKKTQPPVTKAPTPTPTPKKFETPPTVKVETLAPVVTPVAAPPVKTPVVAVKEAPKVEKPVEVVDPLDEANQLLIQQRFPQAVGVLNKGLQKNPERSDLMLALLAIYLKQNDHEAFDAQFEQLKQLDDPLALIQAEELHNELERPIVVEDSDLIEFDTKKATVVSEPEPTAETAAPDYAADSLTFTSETFKAVEPEHIEPQTPDAESVSLGKTVDITPIETEFSLDDIDLVDTAVTAKDSPVEVVAKKKTDDFDFSEFDDFVIGTQSETKAPVKEAEPVAPIADLADLKVPETETSKTSDLVDLEFDLDDSFTIDEDKAEIVAKKSDWSNDLADETFASPAEAKAPVVPAATPTVGELIKGDALSSLEEEFPFLQSTDTFQIRLDLARNYIALGEISSAKELLNEVAEQGAGPQQTEARDLIAKLAS